MILPYIILLYPLSAIHTKKYKSRNSINLPSSILHLYVEKISDKEANYRVALKLMFSEQLNVLFDLIWTLLGAVLAGDSLHLLLEELD